ncbi:MAG: type II secretion system F family protein [Verrucomicrobia bacterium]|nr:type II secretion system F family protein [Verrucomicrobiota bacterium]
MSNYSYVAVDPRGLESRGTLDVADQTEALRRIKQMGLFPTKVLAAGKPSHRPMVTQLPASATRVRWRVSAPGWGSGIRAAALTVFTRQLATLIEAGGVLDVTLRRLADFMEKAQQIKGKVQAAMYYPCAVLCVAAIILTLLMTYVVPRFKEVFEGLLGGGRLPSFTLFVFHLSEAVKSHILLVLGAAATFSIAFLCALRTHWGRWSFDHFKLAMPLLGQVFRKVAISRFSRTLGTLLGSGVPILQALTIVKETAGNAIVGAVISDVQEQVKAGETIAPVLRSSGVFPAMVAGMVDVGEETGALPEMLLKIADTYDEEVDNAVTAMTSLVEPIMIVCLAVIVGSIVVALFLPLVSFPMQQDGFVPNGSTDN